MAENQGGDAQEKTEEPTAKKRKQAKEKGQVPRSRELNTTMVLLVASCMLYMMSGSIGTNLTEILKSNLNIERQLIFGPEKKLVSAFTTTLLDMLYLFIPYIIILVFVILMTPALIGGWTFSLKAISPKMSKLSFTKGIKRIFGAKGLMELLKSLAKVTLVGLVAAAFIWNYFAELMSLSLLNPGQAIIRSLSIVGWLFILLSLATVVIAGIDIPFQILQHIKELRMSKQEVKDEHKHTEGNPEIKGRIRRLQQEMANSRMMEEIPKADVIVTNPTHYSVAVKYSEGDMSAPIIIGKGVDLIALRIREIANLHKIAIFEAPPLARALYYTTKLNDEIPVDLYHAVAQVLAYVYQLRSHGNDAVKPNAIPIPDQYKRYQ